MVEEVNKTATKTPNDDREATGERFAVSPINGSRLPLGAHAGNTGGKPGRSGRPPSVVRERLRGSFDDRVHILEQIVDGEPMVRTRIPLAARKASTRY